MLKVTCICFVFVLIWSETVVAQETPTCMLDSLEGECSLYPECEYTKNRGDFVLPAIIQKIQQRIAACSKHGSQYVCCEKTPKKPPSYVYSTSKKPATKVNDPLQHQNYKFFKNLKCGGGLKDKVTHGNNTQLYDFPWSTLLGYTGKLQEKIEFNCGGSIISDFYVLTAAHCLAPYIRSYFTLQVVRLGEHDLGKDIDCRSDPDEADDCAEPVKDVAVAKWIAHTGFDQKLKHNDIGLVKLSEAANFKSRGIKPICLPFAAKIQTIPQKLIVTGWGKVSDQISKQTEILQMAELPFYDLEKCKQRFNEYYRENNVKAEINLNDMQFCAGGDGKVDSCRGDSGSPIQAADLEYGKIIQYGIVSYGVNTCGKLEGIPGIYTTVSKYLNWILDNMQ